MPITNVEARAKKLSERRDSLKNTKKRMGKPAGKNAGMSEDQSGSRKNPSLKDKSEKIYSRRRHP